MLRMTRSRLRYPLKGGRRLSLSTRSVQGPCPMLRSRLVIVLALAPALAFAQQRQAAGRAASPAAAQPAAAAPGG
ncbi:hypothetical protein L2196_21675, partial [Xanthomonas perforans]|nr:hypothetical protein [Xanthomonas perforans]